MKTPRIRQSRAHRDLVVRHGHLEVRYNDLKRELERVTQELQRVHGENADLRKSHANAIASMTEWQAKAEARGAHRERLINEKQSADLMLEKLAWYETKTKALEQEAIVLRSDLQTSRAHALEISRAAAVRTQRMLEVFTTLARSYASELSGNQPA